jgi:signal transduction histidine kinase
LQQEFTNLILNACNAMPQGGQLTIVTQAGDTGLAEGRRIVVVQVGDTGHGIAPGDLPRIFDPFFTTMPVGKGIGLGLSISYSIIQQHDGTIDVQSQPGHGTTFSVRLPGLTAGSQPGGVGAP